MEELWAVVTILMKDHEKCLQNELSDKKEINTKHENNS